MNKTGSVIGGCLLIAGTAIGGGMLALPVLTAEGGFLPSCLIFFLCWLFMTATGLLLMEVVLWNQDEVNIISLAKRTIGPTGRIFAWLLYLFLFYSLTVAYLSAGGGLMTDLIPNVPTRFGPSIFVLIFGPCVIIGAMAVDRINWVMMGGLIISFLLFVVLGANKVTLSQLDRADFKAAIWATPVIFTAFGFQGIVPTITYYLGRSPKRVSIAIMGGTSLAFLAYIVWEWLILGVVPLAELQVAKEAGQTAVYPLKNMLNFSWLYTVGQFFAFFAIVTSFLGVTLGLFDFLADGLEVKKDLRGRLLLALLVFGPPLAFATINPKLFLVALHYAGGIGCALLLGLLPILMAYFGRYKFGYKGEYQFFGGKISLIFLFLFIVAEVFLMVYKSS